MTKICSGMDHRYCKVAEEQDAISWRQFMEGMTCRGLRGLQEIYTTQSETRFSSIVNINIIARYLITIQ
jgi:hypothetical protein